MLNAARNTENKIPLSFFAIPGADGDAIFPNYESSELHNDSRYYCYRFYKPISQFSKLC